MDSEWEEADLKGGHELLTNLGSQAKVLVPLQYHLLEFLELGKKLIHQLRRSLCGLANTLCGVTK